MAYLVGVLVMVVGVLISIALHEVGHMVPARRFGVRVSQYMVGFGPTLWSRTRGETEYGIKAIPLGGYVRMVGMYPTPDAVGNPPVTNWFARVAQDAREVSVEEIRPGEEHRAFYRLSTPKKLVVMLGGPVMNLVIATVLLTVVLCGLGVASLSSTVSAVTPCVPAAGATECAAGDPQSPAAAAGLAVGDTVTSFDGTAVTSWTQLSGLIREAGGESVPVVVDRDGADVALTVSPVQLDRAVVDADGEPVLAADGTARTESVGYLGIGPSYVLARQPLSAVPAAIGAAVAGTAEVVLHLPARVVDVAQSAFGSQERDANSVIGVVGIGRIAGEVAADGGGDLGLLGQVVTMLSLIASLNIALFVFNLIPLLPLDGGHVAGALWEGARRQVARLRGLPRPRPVDVARMMPLAYGVFVVLAGVGVLLIYADIVRPVSL
ncbi:M50 family metallopeptidase [Pengzhenrongella sicca]|uniref:Site-2 protease family protein n=1 Tax=Pengzhenrongella sicca TaxID=2819238 RepID=A0A8A4ZLY4_9MICO|nr:site-2 protease family protein [Pengzhenrongella sicca]QTE30578.1 site-2 protease family protein [Pengzhenrongella sicca]